MYVPPSVQAVCWFVFDPKWTAVNALNSVLSSTSLCGTPVGTPNPLRKAMMSQWSNLCALLSLTLFVNKFNCSKHDVTMVSGSLATVCTCNDYRGSNVGSFCSRCGRHDTLSLLTVITKALVECIIEPAHLHGTCSELRVCQNLMEQSKENAEISIIILPYL